MRNLLLILLCFSLVFQSQAQIIERIEVQKGNLISKVPSLKNLRPDSKVNPAITRNLEGLIFKKKWKDDPTDYGTKSSKDTVVQKSRKLITRSAEDKPEISERPSKVSANFEGISFTNVSPADPCMAVGTSHVVQMINGSQGAYLRIWDKSGGSLIDQRYMHQLVGSPNYFAYGDPIVLYDQFADRYIISEFGSDSCATCYSNSLIIGISQTADPTAGWNFYKFNPGGFFVDYPHYAVYPDAIYATSNDYNTSGTSYLGSSVYAIDKVKMMNGDPSAGFQRIRVRSSQYNKYISIAPVSISGDSPPPTAGIGMFMYFHDDNRTSSTSDVDSVGIFSLTPDFNTASNSRLVFDGGLAVAPFKSRICNGSRNCIPSAGGNGYDDVSDRFMNKIYYRNFGTHEAIVANHTVDAAYPSLPSVAGIRWYEFRKSSSPWNIYQQGTYAPDGDGRWMGGININRSGQIALAYNLSGTGRYASIQYTGRNASDPPGIMMYDEADIKKGDAYGTFSNRWGDYNDLVTDPLNDSIFWCTAMYGASTWKTRIAAFKLLPIPALDLKLTGVTNYAAGHTQCNDAISPTINIRNIGTDEITSILFNIEVDGNLQSSFTWDGSLPYRSSTNISLPTVNAGAGAHVLNIYPAAVNGRQDQDRLNDTTSLSFFILEAQTTTISEGFENIEFPPAGWRLMNPDAGSVTWERSTTTGSVGNGSAIIRFFDYAELGEKDKLVSPLIKLDAPDSLILSFDIAYKLYGQSSSFADSLEVLISPDCGNTFISVWKQGGPDLISTEGFISSSYLPSKNEWKTVRVDLKPFAALYPSISVAFQSINRFGQNLYIDNINIRPVKVLTTDAFVRRIISPLPENCDQVISPEVEIGNGGSDTITNLKISYQIENGSVENYDWTGILLPGSATIVTGLKPLTGIQAGTFRMKAFTNLPNGIADDNSLNDTAISTFTIFSKVNAPLKEGFEQSNFPPAGWNIRSSGASYRWEKSSAASTESNASALIRNYRFNSNTRKDDLVSPIINPGKTDSFYLKFDVAHAMGGGNIKDTLEILITEDCGKTVRTLYKKGGIQLHTPKSFPSFPTSDTTGFVPKLRSDWRSETLEISSMLIADRSYQFVFRNTSNKGNNTFIDNINIYGVILPARLKQQGYLISPNPASNQITIQHLQPPTGLKAIQVSNELGQVVFQRSYTLTTNSPITIDVSSFASGIYQVKLIYQDKLITERIVKKR